MTSAQSRLSLFYKRSTSVWFGPNGILKVNLSAYRKTPSTTTALLAIKDILRAMKRGEVTMAVLADFSKAFDTVAFEVVFLGVGGTPLYGLYGDVPLDRVVWRQARIRARSRSLQSLCERLVRSSGLCRMSPIRRWYRFRCTWQTSGHQKVWDTT